MGLILTNNHVVAALNGAPAGDDGSGGQDESGAPVAPSGQQAQDGQAMKATVTLSDGRTAPFSVVGADPRATSPSFGPRVFRDSRPSRWDRRRI